MILAFPDTERDSPPTVPEESAGGLGAALESAGGAAGASERQPPQRSEQWIRDFDYL
jgi:hypothetical protein